MSEATMLERIQMTPEERELMPIIVDKFMTITRATGRELDYIMFYAAVLFCHKLHCPIRLRDWLNADIVTFMDDGLKLYKHYNGQTHTLPDHVKLHFAVSNESRIWVPPNLLIENQKKIC